MTPSLVYNQTWEDYRVDQEALQVTRGDTVLLIASAGCNAFNTLLEDPKKIFAIDMNASQLELCSRKAASISRGEYVSFWSAFSTENQQLYRSGAYGCLRWVHWYVRLVCGKRRLDAFLATKTLDEQKAYYENQIEPVMWRGVRFIPIFFFYAFGIHARQLWSACREGNFFLGDVAKRRVHSVLTTIPIRTNYFWCQIFSGGYLDQLHCPPYLQEKNFSILKSRVDRIEMKMGDLLSFLREQPTGSIEKMNFLDAPEFCPKEIFHEIWKEAARVLRPQGRIVYRSFSKNYFPDMHGLLEYQQDLSERLSQKEMTASYAQVYLFEKLHRLRPRQSLCNVVVV